MVDVADASSDEDFAAVANHEPVFDGRAGEHDEFISRVRVAAELTNARPSESAGHREGADGNVAFDGDDLLAEPNVDRHEFLRGGFHEEPLALAFGSEALAFGEAHGGALQARVRLTNGGDRSGELRDEELALVNAAEEVTFRARGAVTDGDVEDGAAVASVANEDVSRLDAKGLGEGFDPAVFPNDLAPTGVCDVLEEFASDLVNHEDELADFLVDPDDFDAVVSRAGVDSEPLATTVALNVDLNDVTVASDDAADDGAVENDNGEPCVGKAPNEMLVMHVHYSLGTSSQTKVAEPKCPVTYRFVPPRWRRTSMLLSLTGTMADV